MPTYTINGRRFTSAVALSDADLEELAASTGAAPTPVQPTQPAQPQATQYTADQMAPATPEDMGFSGNVDPQRVGVGEQMFGLGSPIARVAKGAIVNPIMGLNQMLAETGVFGEKVKQSARQNVKGYEEATKAARERVGSTGLDLYELGGAVISPTSKLMPAPAATALGRVGQGAATGVAFAGAQPVTNVENYFDEKLQQMGAGALFGGLVSGGFETAGKVKKIVSELSKPLTKEGRLGILRDYLNSLTGGKKDEVIKALQGADEIVPGSRPTAMEAVSDIPEATGIAAYQRQVSRQAPETGVPGQFSARAAEQQAARSGLLQQEVAQTPAVLDYAKSLRAFDADRNYGEAFGQTINANPKLLEIMSNPYIKDVIPDAIKLSEAKGITAKTDLTQVLQYVKIGLDKQLTRTGDNALSRTEKQAVQSAKKELVGWVSAKNPEFARARAAFEEASKPINRMEVGQFLQQRLQTPLDAERAGSFALAVQNAAGTIKKASGQPFERLSDVLTPKQTAAVDNILADLQRTARGQELSGRSIVGAGGKATTELPNLLNRYAVITNTVLRALKKDSNTEINRVAAELLLDPQKMAAFMQGIPASKSNLIADAMLRRVSPEMRDSLIRVLTVSKEELGQAGAAAARNVIDPQAMTRGLIQGANQ
jgi:hypothetical protein